jgi:hypothetical protein
VQDGSLQAWKARQVARATAQLSAAAVAFVDRHLAVTARSNRIPVLNPVIHEARLRCDPDQAAAVEQNALDHRESTATTLLTARLDTLDALDLDGTITDLAGVLGRLGDHRDLDDRRASALGMLAHPQRALDLAAGTDADPGSGRSGLNGSRGMLYLHVSLADLATASGGGRVERLGAASLTLLRDWLQRMAGVTVRPVLDPTRTEAVDAHDPPAWMRELVILRDRHCVFPGCQSMPGPATSTTSSPSSRSTRVGRPARPARRTWPACADGTTGPRLSPAGTTASRMARPPTTRPARPTSGPARTSAPTASPSPDRRPVDRSVGPELCVRAILRAARRFRPRSPAARPETRAAPGLTS